MRAINNNQALYVGAQGYLRRLDSSRAKDAQRALRYDSQKKVGMVMNLSPPAEK